MKILAMAASNSSQSINRKLILHAADLMTSGEIPELGGAAAVEVEVLDLNDFEMPIYSTDREEAGGIPEHAQRFFRKIGEADAVLLSFPEHNGSYSAAFKNLYDWTSRIDMKVYQSKPVVMLATSPGGRGGASVLQAATGSAPFFGADLRASLAIPSFYDKFDSERGTVSDAETAAELRSTLAALAPAD